MSALGASLACVHAFAAPLALAALLMSFAGTGSAQQPIQNGGFASNLSGWQELQQATAQVAWSPLDASNAPGSGSAFVQNFATGANTVATVLRQCVVLAGPGPHLLMASALTPSTAVAGSITARVVIRGSSNCTGGTLGIVAVGFQDPSSFWQRRVEYFDVPIAGGGLYSAEVLFDVLKIPADGSSGGFFDELAIDVVFHNDGFESGLPP